MAFSGHAGDTDGTRRSVTSQMLMPQSPNTVHSMFAWNSHLDGKVWIVDAKGGKSMVTISNVNQSNGVIHVVDTVLMPAS